MCAKVTIKLLLLLQDKIGKSELSYEADTVGELIKKFLEDYREELEEIQILDENTGQFKEWMLILINGRNIRFLEGMNTILNEKDVVAISPPMAGG
ncbi:MAG: MoaD/ThiS family protein [Candidatus Lokiarchaeota archaeon]|nr:MoaD/ThiS family protein [Candidatus Lokiarchaeota archaeon]